MLSRCILNNLTVGCWNIEGVYEKVNSLKICKLDLPFFHETLKIFDILCLQETHLGQDDNIPEINGYATASHCRRKSGNNRYFGGLLIYTKVVLKTVLKLI